MVNKRKQKKIDKWKKGILKEFGSIPYLVLSILLCSGLSAAWTYISTDATDFDLNTDYMPLLLHAGVLAILLWLVLLITARWLFDSIELNKEGE